jgi:hypothetical protein
MCESLRDTTAFGNSFCPKQFQHTSKQVTDDAPNGALGDKTQGISSTLAHAPTARICFCPDLLPQDTHAKPNRLA